jgi:hypothetical protein
VKALKLKVVVMSSVIRRPIPAAARRSPESRAGDLVRHVRNGWHLRLRSGGQAELGIAPTFHSSGRGYGMRVSVSNFTYNHIGHFAVSAEAVCKALFLGGVTRRFPTLKMAFLEGGVGWACNLYADLIGHWKKRNARALAEVDPANLDRKRLAELFSRYAEPAWAGLRSEAGGRGQDPRCRVRCVTTTSRRAESSARRTSRSSAEPPFWLRSGRSDERGASMNESTLTAPSSKRSSAPTSAISTCRHARSASRGATNWRTKD